MDKRFALKAVVDERRAKLRLALMGPAFIAAIGYIDPGNFATNIQAGAKLWL
ncbi:manganese transport protein MntH [Citrobacter koseri]|uniref:Manganese transport protein MntH n=1 Tax=Citrobacter koseri TaxID=545 RepID=A0A2X2XRY7_CITKO|nr:manganese transport protein MntH [Citrobacter koseri]